LSRRAKHVFENPEISAIIGESNLTHTRDGLMDQDFTPEQIDQIKLWLMIVLAIPMLFVVRFFIYLILPRGFLKMFHKKHGYKNKDVLKREKRFYEDD
jgi:hypothetical protein